MNRTVGQSIRQGLSEAVDYATIVADLSEYRFHVPNNIKVKAIYPSSIWS